MFYWEGVKYILTVEYYNGKVDTYTYFTEEDLAEAIKKYGNQVITFQKVMNGFLED